MHTKSNESNSFTLTAVGDILLHGRVYGGLKKRTNFTLDEQMSEVKNLLGQTDLTIANLESIIAGNDFGLSGFPKFNSPVEIGYTLKNMGVDMVTIANNHILDHGEEGLLKSIDNLEKIDLLYDGAYKSIQDSQMFRVFEINGLKIGFVSYTDSSGAYGKKLIKEKPYLVNSFEVNSLLKLNRHLRKLDKEKIVDVIILNLHFGEEYHLLPTSKQKEYVATLADAGANVIIGHHSHVLQPPEWIETSRGTKTFVAYSLGNFFTGQNGLYRQIGAALSMKITKPSNSYKEIVIEQPEYDLTIVNKEERLRYNIYKFEKWLKQNKYIQTEEGKFKSETVYRNVINHLTKNIKDIKIN